jgi:hypothetical protein
MTKTTRITADEFDNLLTQLDERVMGKGETPAEAAENVTGGNRALDAALVATYNGDRSAPRKVTK